MDRLRHLVTNKIITERFHNGLAVVFPTTEPYATAGQQKKNYKRSAALTSTSICGLHVVDRRNPKAMWSRKQEAVRAWPRSTAHA